MASINGINSMIESYLNTNKKDMEINNNKSAAQVKLSEDSYVPSTKFATDLGVYTNEGKSIDSDDEIEISREEYERYCSVVSDGNGKILLYYPPENAPAEVKKTWIEAMKKLTPEEQFMARTAIFVEAQVQAKQGLTEGIDFNLAQKYLNGLSSYQDIFLNSLKISKDNLAKGEGNKEYVQRYIEIMESVLDIFVKHGVK